MSDLLKVKIGGSDYLCKWKPSDLYQFNLNSFDLQTLKDGRVQWHTSGPSVGLTKVNDALKISFVSGTKQYFGVVPNEIFSDNSKFSVEVEYSSPGYPYMSYLCILYGVYIQAEGTRMNGIWAYNGRSWKLGPSFSNASSDKTNVKCLFERKENYYDIRVFLNELYVGNTTSYSNYDGTGLNGTNTDYNGSSSPGIIYLHKFIIRKES